ncbi:MAG: hypothetical protein AAB492_05480, partial [Patescibacteria group bacterium]
MSTRSLEQEKNFDSFDALHSAVRDELAKRIKERIRTNPQKTLEEEQLGAYIEEIEPQMVDAVREIHRKGYTVFLEESGFDSLMGKGKEGIAQVLFGGFLLDPQITQTLLDMQVQVAGDSKLAYRIAILDPKHELNITQQNLHTYLRFFPDRPNLMEIKQ